MDGVFTDGTLVPLADGDLLRVFNAKDSFGFREVSRRGLITGIISGGDTEALRRRCLSLGVKEENLFLGSRGKLVLFGQFCSINSLRPEEVAYIGDDIPDIPVIRACGLGITPSDAAQEARDASDFVSNYPGGRGCVRESAEMILRAQGKWDFDDDEFKKVF